MANEIILKTLTDQNSHIFRVTPTNFETSIDICTKAFKESVKPGKADDHFSRYQPEEWFNHTKPPYGIQKEHQIWQVSNVLEVCQGIMHPHGGIKKGLFQLQSDFFTNHIKKSCKTVHLPTAEVPP